ncbi:MAG TPA: TonB family protein [Puia sp.]|jgi:protein TonB|nr:TonB family protein [Puia sp.]
MESNKILGADILDILFEGRNKEYGAYELRKTYNRRLGRAMAVTGSVILLLFVSGFVGKHGAKKVETPKIADIDLTAVKAPDPTPPVIPPAPKAPQVKTVIFTPPKIVPNDKVPDDEKPPVQDDLDKVKIGTVNTPGADDPGITAPPSDQGKTGVVVAPKKQDDDDGIFEKVEVESSYPGGVPAWIRYLQKNMHYPDQAVNNETQGTVMVKFIVDKDGNVSDVEAVAGPEQDGLREEAVRVIKKSGKWTPALQNGRYVKSYKQQPVTFKLSE